MNVRNVFLLVSLVLAVRPAVGADCNAVEVTIKNDSATDGSLATPCLCFAPGDEAAAWLTAPCGGEIVAVQIFWKSPFGNVQ